MSRCLFLFLIACAPDLEVAPADTLTPQDTEISRGETVEGEFELLDFLNSPDTDVDVLDLDVGLDSRAARSLIRYRDGDDGVFPSEDDELYSNYAEVDRIERVGPATLDALLDYALWWANPPALNPGEETVVEGVAFTARQAEATVSLANFAGIVELDDDVHLDRRAVDAIIDARPIDSLHDLASVYYVGPTALRALRDYAGEPGPTHPEFGQTED